MLTQKFTSSVWPSVQISWTVCMILSVLFCSVLVEPFHVEKTSSYCIHSLTFHSCDLGLFAVFPRIFSFFTLLGAFSLMSSSFHFPGLKLILLFRLILCRMEFWWLKKKTLIIIFLIFMFCVIRLKLNIPTFYTTGNKRQQNLFLPSYVLFIIFALCRQPHSVSRKLCVKEWPLPPPLHPWSHLYFCAFLHRRLFECRWHKKTFIATKYICFSICCYWSVAFDACIDCKITDPQWEISIMTLAWVLQAPSFVLLHPWVC